MKKVAVEATKLTVSALVELAKKGPVILTSGGKPLASVKDLSGSDWESVALANNPHFLALIEESRRSYHEAGGLTIDEVRRELGLPTKRRPSTRKKTNQVAKKA